MKAKILFTIFMLMALPACFHNSGSSTPVAALDMNTTSALIWNIDGTTQLTVFPVDDQGQTLDKDIVYEWSSSDVNIATVDQSGLVTAHAEGEVTIVVKGGGLESSIVIIVDTDVITIDLAVQYEDKLYNADGFYDTQMKPARFVAVDILGANELRLAQTYTDQEGKLSAIIPRSLDLSVRVVGDLKNDTMHFQVRDLNNSLYSIYKHYGQQTTNDPLTFDIPVSLEAVGVFNILDVFAMSGQFVDNYQPGQLMSLVAYWQPGSLSGTFFCADSRDYSCSLGKGIYVLSETGGDTDEFDDDVLMHEFGHYVASLVSRDSSPGGCHDFTSNDLDLRLSWSEGWGDFFPMAVKTWASSSAATLALVSASDTINTSHYVDTFQNIGQLVFDIAHLEDSLVSDMGLTLSQIHVYASSELAVNKILWRLQGNFGMQAIWPVFSDYLSNAPIALPINLEMFWNGWMSVHVPVAADISVLNDIFGERKVYYQLDQYEPDDSIATAGTITVNTSQTHYLYTAPGQLDKDFFRLDVVSGQNYVVETTNLTSGADTNIRILDANGKLVSINGTSLENNDYRASTEYEYRTADCGYVVSNNGTALSSKVQFIAPANDTYYIEVVNVASFTSPKVSAGRYGSYDLKVSQ